MEKESREKQIYRVTIVGSIANFFLLVFKFVAGILGQSSAMIADAVHSLSDFVTDIIVLVFVKVSAKPKDAGHDYGHGKYETLATAIIGIVLLMVGTGIFWNGLNQILAFYRGVLDPIAAVIVSIFIVKVSIQLLIPCLNDLLERSLPEETEKEIITIINEDPQIKDPHNLRTRRIGNDFAIEVHIRLRPDMTVQEAHVVATGIENRLRAKYGLRTHVAVHVEPEKNE